MTPDFGPAELQALYERMGVLPHAVLGLPNADQVRTLLARDAIYDRQARENDEDFLAVFDLSRYYSAPTTQPAPAKP